MPKVTLGPATHDPDPTHPALGAGTGPYSYHLLTDLAGLTQFGAHVEVLPPGSRSSHRHWHEAEDEMVYMLAGEVVLIEDTETALRAGEAACWPAGLAVGHCLENRSDQEAMYLVIGTRSRTDRIHYPDHGLVTDKDGPDRRYSRKPNSERPERPD